MVQIHSNSSNLQTLSLAEISAIAPPTDTDDKDEGFTNQIIRLN